MKSPKPLFSNLQSTVFILSLAVFILICVLITSKTLHTEAENPLGPPNVNANTGNSAPDSRAPVKRPGNPLVTVWVNTKSGIYHCPNTPWYGDTKNGQFMTQHEAQAKGYRPAYGIVCG